MSEQQREEKQSRASSFSHKALAQAIVATKGIPGPVLHTLSYLMAKSFCLHATRLGSANRQTLESLIPKFLQILLHAESSTLLFY